MPDIEDRPTPEVLILERIAKLEGRLDTEQQSLSRKLGQWMALLALIISIAVGVFQVYENTILRKQEQISADRSTLAGYVQQITGLNSRLVSVFYSTSDKLAARALQKTLNIEKLSILGLADDLLSKRKEIASYAILFTLSSEFLDWGNTMQARKYAGLALALATTDVEKIEAQRITARTWFTPGKEQNIKRGREIFDSAIRAIESIKFFGKTDLFGNVYVDWISSELAIGDCTMAKEIFQRFEGTLVKEHGGVELLNLTKAQISATFGSARGCRLF